MTTEPKGGAKQTGAGRTQENEKGKEKDPQTEGLPTYQEMLDDTLEDTFPASDPVSPGTAAHTGKPVRTGKDDKDWELKPKHPEKKQK